MDTRTLLFLSTRSTSEGFLHLSIPGGEVLVNFIRISLRLSSREVPGHVRLFQNQTRTLLLRSEISVLMFIVCSSPVLCRSYLITTQTISALKGSSREF